MCLPSCIISAPDQVIFHRLFRPASHSKAVMLSCLYSPIFIEYKENRPVPFPFINKGFLKFIGSDLKALYTRQSLRNFEKPLLCLFCSSCHFVLLQSFYPAVFYSIPTMHLGVFTVNIDVEYHENPAKFEN